MVDGWLAKLRPVVLAAGLLGFGLAATNAGAEPRLALVIGNSSYANTPPLANPANDAKLMSTALTSAGFEVSSFTDLDQRDMKRAVRDFADKVGGAGPGAVALFYYAGHGLQVDGVNYLIPIDSAIDRESDVAIEAVGLPDVLSSIEFAGASVNIVILDACRDNPLKRSFRSTSRGLARVDAPTGSIVAYATAPGQTAADGNGTNSPYSSALATAIQEPGVPIEQVFKQVRISVKAATGDKQVPWESSSLTSDFFFVKGDTAAPAPLANVPPAVTPPPPDQPSGTNDLAEADYLAAVSADTIEAYRGFLEKYPTSLRAPQVRQIISFKVEGDAWQRAEAAGSAGGYRQYLAAFPDGPHKSAAELKIASLESTPPPPEVPRNLPAVTPPSDTACGPAGPYRVVEIASNDILSVRAGPGRDAQEIGTIPPDGNGIAVGNCVPVQGYRSPWCEVRYQCLSGWAYARYLTDASGIQPGGSVASTEPPATSGSETFRVTGVESWDYLNIRSGPGTNYEIVVGIPPNGNGVSVAGCQNVRGYRNKWCQASWQGYSGWTSSCCLVGERSGRRLD